MSALVAGHWLPAKDGDVRGMAMFKRHYSFREYRDHRRRVLFVGPGEKMVLLTEQCDAMFVWRKFIDDSGETGVNCAVFRNESDVLASDMVREADELAFAKWPGERHYTYVDPRKIQRTRQPGRCFYKAGWHFVRALKDGKHVLAIDHAEK